MYREEFTLMFMEKVSAHLMHTSIRYLCVQAKEKKVSKNHPWRLISGSRHKNTSVISVW